MVDSPRSEKINVLRPLVVPGVSSTHDTEVEELMRLIRKNFFFCGFFVVLVFSTPHDMEFEELMRLIRKSDYNIIEQLHHTPSKMSILSLLFYSEAHRNALMKLLGQF